MLTYNKLVLAEYNNDIITFRKILQTRNELRQAYKIMEDDVGGEYYHFNKYLKRHLPQRKTIWLF